MMRLLITAAVTVALLAPGPMTARAQGAGPDSLQVSWTATGDDGTVGTASLCELRISTAPITLANWSGAGLVPGVPPPSPSGTRQQALVRGLSPDTTYYLAIRAVDDAGNWSGLSNVVRWDWTHVPPAAPVGLAAVHDAHDVRLSWTPNQEADLAGYFVYRATGAAGPYTKLNAAVVPTSNFIDSSLPAGATALWYEVTASDAAGLESPASVAVRVDLTTATGTAWTLSPAFPNPSSSAEPVCIPFTVPATGVGDAALDILDAGGRRVRHLAIAGATVCGSDGVLWDGRNESGRSVAPGIYSVRLTADGEPRSQTRLVRQP